MALLKTYKLVIRIDASQIKKHFEKEASGHGLAVGERILTQRIQVEERSSSRCLPVRFSRTILPESLGLKLQSAGKTHSTG